MQTDRKTTNHESCIDAINAELAHQHRQLAVAIMMDGGRKIGLPILPMKRGVRKTLLFPAFCPFCGERTGD